MLVVAAISLALPGGAYAKGQGSITNVRLGADPVSGNAQIVLHDATSDLSFGVGPSAGSDGKVSIDGGPAQNATLQDDGRWHLTVTNAPGSHTADITAQSVTQATAHVTWTMLETPDYPSLIPTYWLNYPTTLTYDPATMPTFDERAIAGWTTAATSDAGSTYTSSPYPSCSIQNDLAATEDAPIDCTMTITVPADPNYNRVGLVYTVDGAGAGYAYISGGNSGIGMRPNQGYGRRAIINANVPTGGPATFTVEVNSGAQDGTLTGSSTVQALGIIKTFDDREPPQPADFSVHGPSGNWQQGASITGRYHDYESRTKKIELLDENDNVLQTVTASGDWSKGTIGSDLTFNKTLTAPGTTLQGSFRLRATDEFGNSKTSDLGYGQIDGAAPTIADVTLGGAAIDPATTYSGESSDLPLTFTIADVGSGMTGGFSNVAVQVDGQPVTPVKGAASYAAALTRTTGTHDVVIDAWDAAGNVAEKRYAITMVKVAPFTDTVQPYVLAQSTQKDVYQSGECATVQLTFADAESKVMVATMTSPADLPAQVVADTPWVKGTPDPGLTISQQVCGTLGVNQLVELQARAVDAFGNAKDLTIPLKFDATAPAISGAELEGTPLTANTIVPVTIGVPSARLHVSAADSFDQMAHLDVKVDDQLQDVTPPAHGGSDWYSQLALPAGDHSIEVTATDRAGNASSMSYITEITVGFDTVAPTITSADVDQQSVLTGSPIVIAGDNGALLQVQTQDDTSYGVGLIALLDDNFIEAAGEAGSFAVDLGDLIDGPHTLQLLTADLAGNNTGFLTYTFDYQHVDPTRGPQLTSNTFPTTPQKGCVTGTITWTSGQFRTATAGIGSLDGLVAATSLPLPDGDRQPALQPNDPGLAVTGTVCPGERGSGVYPFYTVAANPFVGNEPQWFYVTFDVGAPVIAGPTVDASVVGDGDEYATTVATSFRWHLTDDLTGIDVHDVTLDGAPVDSTFDANEGSTDATVAASLNVPAGSHSLSLHVTDRAGNEATRTVRIVGIAPPAPGRVTVTPTVTPSVANAAGGGDVSANRVKPKANKAPTIVVQVVPTKDLQHTNMLTLRVRASEWSVWDVKVGGTTFLRHALVRAKWRTVRINVGDVTPIGKRLNAARKGQFLRIPIALQGRDAMGLHSKTRKQYVVVQA